MLLAWSFIWLVFQLNEPWLIQNITQAFPMTSSTKMMVTGWLGILLMWDFTGLPPCHVLSYRSSNLCSVLIAHPLPTTGGWESRGRKEAHDVTWVCVSFGCLLGLQAESLPRPLPLCGNSCSPLLNVSPTNQGSWTQPHNLLLQPEETGFCYWDPSPSNIPFYFLQLRFHRYAVFGFLLSLRLLWTILSLSVHSTTAYKWCLQGCNCAPSLYTH